MISYSLTINGQYYSPSQLNQLVKSKLNATNAPQWERDIYIFIDQWSSRKKHFQLQTSGTTGQSKKIIARREQLIASARLTGTQFQLNPGNKALLCLPVKYIAGKMMIVRAFVLKLNLVLIEPGNNPFNYIDEPIHFSAMVPMQIQNALAQKDWNNKQNFVETLIIGGGQVTPELEKKMQFSTIKIWETFGMTETLSHIAVRKLNGQNRVPYFRTLEGISISRDSRNCLVVNAPQLNDNEIITNDLIKIIDGNTFKWLGRYDHLINSGGIKIIPEKHEKIIASIIQRRNYFIAGLPDSILGQKQVLVIEGDAYDTVQLTDMKKSLFKLLSGKNQIKEIYFCKNFVYGKGKKIKRTATLSMVML